jgi:hypothetical protein
MLRGCISKQSTHSLRNFLHKINKKKESKYEVYTVKQLVGT